MTFRDIVILAGFALLVPGHVFAEEPPAPGEATASPSLLERCWMPYALTGTEEELKPGRSRVRFDLRALKQEPLAEPVPVPQELRGSIRSVELPPGKKLIALTFDLCEGDGGSAGYDGRIVDLLRAEGIKATFFASGKWLETHPERAQQLIADPNFELGGHGLRHRDFTHVSATVLGEEIRLTDAAYARARKAFAARSCVAGALEVSGAPQERLTLMRFPYGRCNAASLAAVAEAGQLAIQWDVVTGDPDPRVPAKTIANTILARVHPGAIVVAHANGRGRHTAAALELALPKLKDEGYSFVTVSELLAAGKPVIADQCYLNHPGGAPRVVRAKRRNTANDTWPVLRSR